jgi:hypothetical protein
MTGAPGLEPEASVLETEMLSVTPRSFNRTHVSRRQESNLLATLSAVALQATADPYGFFGLAFASAEQMRQKAKSELLYSLKTS